MEDKDVVVKVEHVSKKFSRTLKRSMLYGASDISRNAMGMGSHPEKLRKGEFWAVDDVSFELRKGEALGLIGPNGSGKSTLLKMLNGIYWPDKGKITIKGRVGALIEVGAGFHPLLTGRENIYVNAAILGMTKKETDARLDDIIKFADIGDFLDSPVKYYSSGMYVRLGFAVAVHCEPDVLLVDEVLSVGDVGFRTKSFNMISNIIKESAVVFVSHSMSQISVICDKAFLLSHGKTLRYGPEVDNIIEIYNNLFEAEKIFKQNFGKTNIFNIKLLSKIKNSHYEINYGDSLEIEFDAIIDPKFKSVEINVGLAKTDMQAVSIFLTKEGGKVLFNNFGSQLHFHITVPEINLAGGRYFLRIVMIEANTREVVCRYENISMVYVKGDYEYGALAHYKTDWQIN